MQRSHHHTSAIKPTSVSRTSYQSEPISTQLLRRSCETVGDAAFASARSCSSPMHFLAAVQMPGTCLGAPMRPLLMTGLPAGPQLTCHSCAGTRRRRQGPRSMASGCSPVTCGGGRQMCRWVVNRCLRLGHTCCVLVGIAVTTLALCLTSTNAEASLLSPLLSV